MAKDGKAPVAVTGIGVLTSLGAGAETNWARLTAGESGIRRVGRFDTEGMRTSIAGTVDFLDVDPVTMPRLCHAMTVDVVDEAVGQAGLGEDGSFPGELFVAAPPIEHDWISRKDIARRISCGERNVYAGGRPFAPAPAEAGYGHEEFLNGTLADRMAVRYGTRGSPVTVQTACSSGATAIQLGIEAIRRGNAPAALAVGVDGSVFQEALIRFLLLSALSTKDEVPEAASKPFSKNRDGFVMAEGAAALILEDPEHARARGAEILALVRGCGEAADTFHRTRSNPDGQAIVRSMTTALDDAGIDADTVEYVNAHGTSTPENDKMEYQGIRAVFGERAEGGLPVSSNKSMIGHTISAAGAVEACFSVLTLTRGVLPPTINYNEPDPNIPIDCVPNTARKAEVGYVLSNSFGFGGQNASIVFSRPDA